MREIKEIWATRDDHILINCSCVCATTAESSGNPRLSSTSPINSQDDQKVEEKEEDEKEEEKEEEEKEIREVQEEAEEEEEEEEEKEENYQDKEEEQEDGEEENEMNEEEKEREEGKKEEVDEEEEEKEEEEEEGNVGVYTFASSRPEDFDIADQQNVFTESEDDYQQLVFSRRVQSSSKWWHERKAPRLHS